MADKPSLFDRLKQTLVKTRDSIRTKVEDLVKYYTEINDSFFEDLEDVLVSADVGAALSGQLVGSLRERVKREHIGDPERIKDLLKDEIASRLIAAQRDTAVRTPLIILMVGVNGTGKTTTSAKLANLFLREGKSVLFAAADTFRAAAIDQLKVWAGRIGVDVIAQSTGSDPAAVVFDAVQAAKARHTDVLIVDTAGRLHNKKNLMNELEKVQRVIAREFPEAHRETYLVLDATTGQNAISQAQTFSAVANVTGLILTKLDGTAKGGIVIGISSTLKVPVRYLTTGETVEDIQPFDAKSFADAMFEG